MQNIMQACIHKQPEALLSTLAHRDETITPFVEAFAAAPLARVALVGAGSSYHALNMARAYAQAALGVPVIAGTPAQLDWLGSQAPEGTLLVAASQSGTSTNTLAFLKDAMAKGYKTVAITQNPDSPIAKLVDCHVTLMIPEEKAGPKTMGVMGTMLTLQLMACRLAKAKGMASDEAALERDIRQIAQAMPENIAQAMAWCDANSDALMGPTYAVVSQGAQGPVAGEAALKIVETVRVSTTAYELEEIVHGPVLALSPATVMLYLGTAGEEHTRPEALLDLCRSRGGKAFYATMTTGAAGFDGPALTLSAPDNALLAAYTLLLPAQVISAYIPPKMGIDLDARTRAPQEAILAGHL